jgi:hypothetical protein
LFKIFFMSNNFYTGKKKSTFWFVALVGSLVGGFVFWITSDDVGSATGVTVFQWISGLLFAHFAIMCISLFFVGGRADKTEVNNSKMGE